MPTPHPAIIPRSLDLQAADVLRQQILSGSLAPGKRLLETEMSEQFGLSRGTIRSALQQLTHEGLVVQYPYRGWAVCSLSAQDAWELYTLRQALEGLAAGLAAEKITPDRIEILQTGLADLEVAAEQADWQTVAQADFALHQAVIQISEHRRLQQQYRIVEQQIRLYIIACNALNPDLKAIAAEHQQLVAAILSGDAAQAETVAKAHNRDGAMLVELLGQQESAQL